MKLSARRSRRALGFSRSSLTYQPRRQQPAGLVGRMNAMTSVRPRFGYRRLHVMLRRDGWSCSPDLVYRLYKEDGLGLRTKRRQKLAAKVRVPLGAPTRPDERWSIDDVRDAPRRGVALPGAHRRRRVHARVGRHRGRAESLCDLGDASLEPRDGHPRQSARHHAR